MTSSAIYYSTHARKNVIYLLVKISFMAQKLLNRWPFTNKVYYACNCCTYKSKYKVVGVLPIRIDWIVKSNVSSVRPSLRRGFLSDEGPTLETLDYTIRIGGTPTFLYFDLYLHSAYAAHFIYINCSIVFINGKKLIKTVINCFYKR